MKLPIKNISTFELLYKKKTMFYSSSVLRHLFQDQRKLKRKGRGKRSQNFCDRWWRIGLASLVRFFIGLFSAKRFSVNEADTKGGPSSVYQLKKWASSEGKCTENADNAMGDDILPLPEAKMGYSWMKVSQQPSTRDLFSIGSAKEHQWENGAGGS